MKSPLFELRVVDSAYLHLPIEAKAPSTEWVRYGKFCHDWNREKRFILEQLYAQQMELDV